MTAHLLHELKVMFGLSENRNDGNREKKIGEIFSGKGVWFE